jgi:hypothetical protein
MGVEHEPRNGFQWQTIGPGLVVFGSSIVLTFLFCGGEWDDRRLWTALNAAGLIFIGAMFGMRIARLFVPREHLSLPSLFLTIWAIAFLIWLAFWR